MAAPDPAPQPCITVVLGGRPDPADVRRLCDEVRDEHARLAQQVIRCDVAAVDRPDFAVVDALARLLLTARRLGCRMELLRASPELIELLAFSGLCDEVPGRSESGVESRG